MKKVMALVLFALVIMSLTVGCGIGSANTTKGSAIKADSTQTQASSSSSEAQKQEVTLKYMTCDYADRTKSTDAWIKDLKDMFNITLDLQNIPTDQYETTVKTKMAASDLPDIMYVHGIHNDLTLYKAKIDPGMFVDISDLKAVADYIPSVVEARKVQGKLYYMPISTNGLGVIYNKKAFSDNGIAIPTNIDEFTTACDKLKAAKIIPIAGGFKDAWTTQIIPFIAFGQYINAKDKTTATKLGDGSLKYADIKDDMGKVLNVQQDWAAKGYFPDNFLGSDINVACQMVGTGKAAMLINGNWEYKSVQDTDPNAQIGWFLLPLNAVGEKTVAPTSADSGLCISSGSKQLDAARQALDYFLSAENQTRVMIEMNGVSLNTKVKIDNQFITEISNSLAAADVQPNWWGPGTDGQYGPGNSSFSMDKQLQSLLAKGTTIDKFIADFDSENVKAFGK